MIDRPEYLKKLILWKDKSDMIKVVTGIRRCGKSTLFFLFQKYLKEHGVKNSQILNVNLEMAENSHLLNYKALYEYVVKKCKSKQMNYVFLDEIQMVDQYQKAINSLRLKQYIDVYITGSNAYMFSQKLTTLLSGRYIEIKMLPLSFKEYMSAFKNLDENSYDRKFNDYIMYGSFPQILNFYNNIFNTNLEFNEFLWHDYMDSIYNTIIVKDIMSKQGIKELSKLNRVIKFMFANIGSQTSLSNISNVINTDLKLSNKDTKIHIQTIENYIQGLVEGYVFYKVTPIYLKGKDLLRSNSKYYTSDTGLRYFLLGENILKDSGHILENIVYLELIRRGYQVEIGKIGNMEIDFVAKFPGGKIEYYQITQTIQNEEVLKRELKPLELLNDNYPKYILSRDYNNSNYNGIEHINVLQWLLGK